MHILGTPDDPAAFTDFDSSNPVEVLHNGRTYYAYRLAGTFSFGEGTGPRVPRLVYVGRPDEQPMPFGACSKDDDRVTVAARLRAFLQENEN